MGNKRGAWCVVRVPLGLVAALKDAYSLIDSTRTTHHALLLLLVLCTALLALSPQPVAAHDPSLHPAQVLEALGFDQRLGEQAPLELAFRNEQGRAVTLGDYFGDRPVLLTLGYFSCPQLCPLVREGLFTGLQGVQMNAGEEFTVVAISIDPAESSAVAARAKTQQIAFYDRPGAEQGIHFLTGDHATIDQLAEAVGFRYAYDSRQAQYAHPSGVVALTPTGEIARYLFGIEYSPRDLRLALVEAGQNQIGSVLDQVLLFCYHYDPVNGQYNLVVMNVLRLAGMATVLALTGGVWIMLRREQLSPG